MESMEQAFISAAKAERDACGDWPVNVIAVLNRLPASSTDDRTLIDAVDEFVDRLYQRKDLFVRGVQWSAEPPTSIRKWLVGLFDRGEIVRDASGRWASQWTCHITLVNDKIRAMLERPKLSK